MKNKLSSIKIFLREISKKKRTWFISGIVLIISLVLILKPNSDIKNIVTETAKLVDLKQTVLATGQVVSNTDLNLSFNTSGVVKSINVKVGDKVKAGQVLANINQDTERATLTTAEGALAAARARLKRTIEGASNEEVALSEITLEQTKLTQKVLVDNAYQNLLNSTPEAVPEDGSSDYTAPIISGTYSLGKEGVINLSMYYSSGGRSFTLSGLVDGTGSVDTVTPQPIGNSGLYIRFPSESQSDISDWVIEIPNKKASDYLINYNAYQSAISQAKFAIDQRTAELALKKAEARGSDIDLANADILSATGQVEQALARYNNTRIIAPVSGTITSIDIKIGELASALEEAMILQDVTNMYIESNINEANIVGLTIGMPVEINFDAFGTENIFEGKVISIDPSSTLISGVVNYKIKVSVESVENLRPGMTANMTIKVKEKSSVITVPSRAILTNKDGTKSIRIITDSKKKKYKETPIITGLNGDGGQVEVTSGLMAGDEFVVLVKTK
jgi:HlyD family secretion protein